MCLKKLHIQRVPEKMFSVKIIAITHFFLTACSDSTQKVLLLFSTSHVNEPFILIVPFHHCLDYYPLFVEVM